MEPPTNPPTPSPESGPTIGPFAALNREDIEKQLRKSDRQENRTADQLERLENRLGEIALADGFRAGAVFDTAKAASRRIVTDPLSPNKENKRVPETLVGKNTLGRAIGRFAMRFSLHGPRGDEIREAEASRPVVSPPSLLGRQSEILTARRVSRQELRQARSKYAETTSGAAFGLGKSAKVRTMKAHFDTNRELRNEYKSGAITAREYVDATQAAKSKKVAVPVKAVRRAVRRERVGAMYSLARAEQPLRKNIRAARKKHAEMLIENIPSKVNDIRARREQLEAELSRRISTEKVYDDDED